MTTYRHLTVLVEPDPDAVRVEQVRDDEYLVAPVVAVAEGVLNGGYLPFEEIAKSAPGWNGVPVTVNHPSNDDGEFIPANQPAVLERYQIGRFLNVEANREGKKLDGEIWMRLAAVSWLVENDDELGPLAKQTVEKVKDGEKLEVSTGYWHGVENQSGEYEGYEYEATQVDLLPDHLAALPESEGACNWDGDSTASGCGAPRTQASDAIDAANAGGGGLAFAANCDDCGGSCNDCDCDADDPATFREKIGNAVLSLAGVDEDTDPTADDVPYALHGANCNCDTCSMDNGNSRLERIANASAFDVEELREKDESTVNKIEESLDLDDNGADGGDGDGDGDGGSDPTANAGSDGSGQTLADMSVDEFREEVASVAENVVESKNEQSKRDELVREIVAYSSFEEDELPEDVEKLESMRDKLDAQTSTTPNYGGRAAGTNGADDEISVDDIDGVWASQEAEELLEGE